jgi:hypothetical protein
MKVEIFYFEDCRNHRPASERVLGIMREEGIAANVTEIEVPDQAAAKEFGVPGSPTIRVNGVDIDPASRNAPSGSIACRLYSGGLPPAEMIRAALREARERRV